MTLRYGVEHLSKGAISTAAGDSDENFWRWGFTFQPSNTLRRDDDYRSRACQDSRCSRYGFLRVANLVLFGSGKFCLAEVCAVCHSGLLEHGRQTESLVF